MTEQELAELLTTVQPATKAPIYRLYYNSEGAPLFYSQEDLPGNYVELTQQQFHEQPKHIRIVDGKIEILNTVHVKKLKISTHGTPCHPEDVSIVVGSSAPNKMWRLI